MKDWYLLQDPETLWLVDGLFPADGDSAIAGKPKAGKSTLIRNLIACVIKSRPFLGRVVNLPAATGRVLYIHLDRKDRPGRVAAELKNLGINSPDEVSRLEFIIASDLPAGKDERIDWLKHKVQQFKPHLIVIDLLLQFIDVQNNNDYKQTLTAINGLQDGLHQAGHTGALVASFHARKAASMDNPADDVLGSTAIRGSFGTLVILTQQRSESRYTITSDQTDREEPWGEIDPTEILRNPDGTMSLGQSLTDLVKASKKSVREVDISRLLDFLSNNPGSTVDEITSALETSKPRALGFLKEVHTLVCSTGAGIKGDPKRYSIRPIGLPHVTQESDSAADEYSSSSVTGYVN